MLEARVLARAEATPREATAVSLNSVFSYNLGSCEIALEVGIRWFRVDVR